MASGNDMRAATETYGSFVTLLKWGAISVAIVAACVVALIAS
jgi:hypothetical protein